MVIDTLWVHNRFVFDNFGAQCSSAIRPSLQPKNGRLLLEQILKWRFSVTQNVSRPIRIVLSILKASWFLNYWYVTTRCEMGQIPEISAPIWRKIGTIFWICVTNEYSAQVAAVVTRPEEGFSFQVVVAGLGFAVVLAPSPLSKYFPDVLFIRDLVPLFLQRIAHPKYLSTRNVAFDVTFFIVEFFFFGSLIISHMKTHDR